MNFTQMKTALQILLQDSDTDVTTELDRWVNWSAQEIYYRRDWPFRRAEKPIFTVAPYETGTLTATDASATLTGSGTTWTADMVGRRIAIGSGTERYTIASFTSSTSITIYPAFSGTTASSLTYSIYVEEYPLPWDVNTIIDVRSTNLSESLEEIALKDYDENYGQISATTGSPYLWMQAGQSVADYYSGTGTVMATLDSATITGSSTVFTAAMRGMTFRINSIPDELYEIRTYTSATSITIFPTYKSATTAGLAYAVNPAGTRLVKFYPYPDAVYQLWIRYYKAYTWMTRNTDIPDIPPEYHEAIVAGALVKMYESFESVSEARFQWAKDRFARLIGVMDTEMRPSIARVEQIGRRDARRGRKTGLGRLPSSVTAPSQL